MAFKTIVVDDEPLAIDLMQEYISKSDGLVFQASFTNPIEALTYIKSNSIDLILLDIEMPGLNGIDLSRLLPKNCSVIFTTAHRNFAPEAFEIKALDYLLKPIKQSRFLKAIEKLEEKHTQQREEKIIVIRADRKDYYVKQSQILYIEGLKDYTKIHTVSTTLLSRGSLGSFLKTPAFSFLKRIHKSFAINPVHVTAKSAEGVYIKENLIPCGDVYK